MNGGDDASILYHEYTHGLSNRLIRDAGGAGALNSAQAGAMGEGWSDWYAKDFLVDEFPALDDPAVSGDVHMGVYTDATPNSIRSQGARLPGRRVAAVCPGAGSRARAATPTATSARSAAGPRCTPTARSGPRRCGTCAPRSAPRTPSGWSRRAMRLSPPEPSFLDERNAILLADQAAGGTLQRRDLDGVRARAGWATTPSTTGSDDIAPVEDFSAAARRRTSRAGRSPGA